jgi:hypothetical protein
MIPIRTAELAVVPKTVEGFKMVNAERAAVPVINFLRLMSFMVIDLNEQKKPGNSPASMQIRVYVVFKTTF